MSTKNFSTHTAKYKRVLSAVHMIYRLVNATSEVPELSLRLTRLLEYFVKSSSASIHILDESKKRLLFSAFFDGKINILVEKKAELTVVAKKYQSVIFAGQCLFGSHIIGLPLIADDNLGAVFVERLPGEMPFDEADKEILNVFAEQSVTAIKNLQYQKIQHTTIFESIRLIGRLLEQKIYTPSSDKAAYFKVVKILAEELRLPQPYINHLYFASILHNIGIFDIPQHVFLKKDKLTSDEVKIIRSHPQKSVQWLKSIVPLKPILPIILHHHERFDGTGYPSGMKGGKIPVGARIVALVDAFEAMIQGRPYRAKMDLDQALAEIYRHRGTQFDPKVVDIFLKLSRQKKIRNLLRQL